MTQNSTIVQADEVADLLCDVVHGRRTIRLADAQNPWSAWGDIGFIVDGWRIVFYNDCDSLDYVDSVTAPDGRVAEFDSWVTGNAQNNPIDLLTAHECNLLESELERAK
jgi:hypothetical protein